jgi:hypothetical protein
MGSPRGILLLLPALALAAFGGIVLLRKAAPRDPEPARTAPPAAAEKALEPPPAPPLREAASSLPSALPGADPARLELRVLDDLGRSPGPSAYCLEDAGGTRVFGRTDEKGKAAIELPGKSRSGDCKVYAGRLEPGRRLYWARDHFDARGATAFTLTYGRLSQIEGVASEPDGQRVRDAQIRIRIRGRFPANDPASTVFDKLMGSPGEWEFLSRTDAAGVFRLDHLSQDLGMRFELVSRQEGDFQSITTDLSREPGGTDAEAFYRAPVPGQYSLMITRNHALVLSASVLTWDGLPVPQALVSLRVESAKSPGELGPRTVLKTDALGRGKVPLGPLSDRSSSSPPAGTPRVWAAAWKAGLGLAYSTGALDVARPEIVVRFPKARTGPAIQGQVLDQNSLVPLRNADVRITSTLFEKAQLADLRTDARGNFSLEGLQAPDAAWRASLEKGFRFFAEIRPPGSPTDSSGTPADALELRPGTPERILLPKRP